MHAAHTLCTRFVEWKTQAAPSTAPLQHPVATRSHLVCIRAPVRNTAACRRVARKTDGSGKGVKLTPRFAIFSPRLRFTTALQRVISHTPLLLRHRKQRTWPYLRPTCGGSLCLLAWPTCLDYSSDTTPALSTTCVDMLRPAAHAQAGLTRGTQALPIITKEFGLNSVMQGQVVSVLTLGGAMRCVFVIEPASDAAMQPRLAPCFAAFPPTASAAARPSSCRACYSLWAWSSAVRAGNARIERFRCLTCGPSTSRSLRVPQRWHPHPRPRHRGPRHRRDERRDARVHRRDGAQGVPRRPRHGVPAVHHRRHSPRAGRGHGAHAVGQLAAHDLCVRAGFAVLRCFPCMRFFLLFWC